MESRSLVSGRPGQNGDGVISSEELIVAAEALANDLQERLPTKYDANQDGTITSEEALAVHQAHC